uniref:Histone deacetylase complex subunit SAP30 Sin3 binding domain-containing protein n=1 Tax=Rhizophora mucronata TaxID=61149 RepID=A0A2P2KMF4_RHIMU
MIHTVAYSGHCNQLQKFMILQVLPRVKPENFVSFSRDEKLFIFLRTILCSYEVGIILLFVWTYMKVLDASLCKVLKNGDEVKLQRNALSVLEHPTGNEVDDDKEIDSSSGSDICEKDQDISSGSEYHKNRKPRVRPARPYVPSASTAKSANRSSYRDVQSIIHTLQPKVNLAKLGTESLSRYCRHFKLAGITSDSLREQMLNAVLRHFVTQPPLDEMRVLAEFARASKRTRHSYQPAH